jgi:23S rRNA pseudouridine955/2504/2580 synthase
MSEAQARAFTVTEDDDGIRLDRWFKRNLPEVSFNIVSRWARTGQLRLDGKRAAPGDRIEAGQVIRVPPPEAAPARSPRPQRRVELLTPEETELVREMVIYQDAHAFVLAKPPGLATQGGTKTHHHLDRLLDGLADDAGARSSFFQTDKTLLADNQVVEHVDVEQFARADDLLGHAHVLGGGRWVATRMVVRDDDGGAVAADRFAE